MIKFGSTIITNDGISYITFGKELFQVIGVVGGNVSSAVDYNLYVNMNEMPAHPEKRYIYVLDGKEDMEKQYEQLATHIPDVYRIEEANRGSNRIFSGQVMKEQIKYFLVIIVITGLVLCTNYWFFSKRTQVAVQMMIGHQVERIYFQLFKRYMFFAIVASLTGRSVAFLLTSILVFFLVVYLSHRKIDILQILK